MYLKSGLFFSANALLYVHDNVNEPNGENPRKVFKQIYSIIQFSVIAFMYLVATIYLYTSIIIERIRLKTKYFVLT